MVAVTVPSYNQPKFDSSTVWSENAVTFANSTIIGTNPNGLFVDVNNTIYVANRANSRVHIWLQGDTLPARNITTNLNSPYSVFAASNDDIYIDNGFANGRIDRWTMNESNSAVMSVTAACYDIFIDIANSIYCSMSGEHRIIKKSSNSVKIIAGTGVADSTSYTLNAPNDIFVDTNFDLYVADTANNRIQLFQSGQSQAITVAGSGSLNQTILLNRPTSIVLDDNKYLFIVDQGNHRIVANGPNGFRCLIGCNENSSSFSWRSMSFDTFGNIFAVDTDNDQIQKFVLLTNSCS